MRLLLLWPLLVAATFAQGPGLIYAVGAGNPAQDIPNILGGYRADPVTGVAVDAAGNTYITGNTYSSAFPASAEAIQSGLTQPPRRAFVAKLSPDGSRFLYALLIDRVTSNAIAVDSGGNVFIAGEARDVIEGAPTSLDVSSQGWWNRAFVAKINASGSAVVFAAYLSGTAPSLATSIALDPAGNIYLTGTAGENFPVTPGAYVRRGARSSAFVSKLNPSGTVLVYSAVLGGTLETYPKTLAVDRGGSAYIGGSTSAPDLPITPGAFQTAPGQFGSGFLTRLSAAGDALLYSTYLGESYDAVNALALDREGNAYVAGSSIVKLNASGSALVYSFKVAGATSNAIAVDSSGNAYVTGASMANLPIVNAIEPSFFGGTCTNWTSSGMLPTGYSTCSDAFVAALNSSGSKLLFSTYLSGSGKDSGLAIALDAQANVYVGGMGMLGLAETNPISNKGSAFIVKLGGNRVLPYFTRESITNAASFASGLVRPGGAATIFCTNLRGTDGVHVKVNGIDAPIYGVFDTGQQQQINFQVPFESSTLDPPERMNVELSQNGARAFVTGAKVYTTAPGVFTTDGTYGAIQHGLDYRLVTPATPAEKGEIVTVYATGLGQVTPTVPSGIPAPFDTLSRTTAEATVMIGGQRAEILFSGLTPASIGLYQLNVRVPENIASGDQNLIVSFPPVRDGYVIIQPHIVRVDSRPVLIPIR